MKIESGQCKVEGCERPVRTKGLCSMHYQRDRRHGDPTVVKKPGPQMVPPINKWGGTFPGLPTDMGIAMARFVVGDASPRTQARYARAERLFTTLEEIVGKDEAKELKDQSLKAAIRSNGSMSVARYEALGEMLVTLALINREDRSSAK